jgi:F-box protein 21
VDRLLVAQDNIDIITDPAVIPDTLYYLAGKFFKRFDRMTCSFVSNIKEFYPDE